ncbi:MAG: hybrid sensor histidine kinase/response regulator [Candidatus Aureabacteria bacterium]|nr:hybrid sensor histidine kinase/response regulator [Candidatus Auribacterota bacterium]
MDNQVPLHEPANILIVEDTRASRIALHDHISVLGHIPIQAEDGEQALDLLRKQSFDLILLDIMLPKLNGKEVLEALKMEKTRVPPVIIISALDDTENVASCIRLGADDYLVKPWNSTLLNARINASLEKKYSLDREHNLLKELQIQFQKLTKLEKEKEGLIQMLIHDLNNPLSVLDGIIQFLHLQLKKKTLKCEVLEEELIRSAKVGKEIRNMIQDILDISRWEETRKGMEFKMTSCNGVDLARKTFDDFRCLAGQNLAWFRFHSDRDHALIQCDAGILQRVFENLLYNAVKYVPKEKGVDFTIRTEQNRIVYIIKDEGYGIPNGFVDRIFEKYVQVEIRKTGKKYGIGLGLTFCKMAVEGMNGKIRAESEEGKGAAFYVEFPISPGGS